MVGHGTSYLDQDRLKSPHSFGNLISDTLAARDGASKVPA